MKCRKGDSDVWLNCFRCSMQNDMVTDKRREIIIMTKRLFALLSALVLIFSVLPLTAFARTADGYYNGYYYSATLTTTTKTATTKMTYMGTSKIKSSGSVSYIDAFQIPCSESLVCIPSKSSISNSFSPPSGSITSASQTYYVVSTQVNYISVTP